MIKCNFINLNDHILKQILKAIGCICQSWKKVKVKVAQSCPTLCDPMDSTVPGILQARTLACVAFPFPRGSSQPRNRTHISCIAGGFFASWAMREPLSHCVCFIAQIDALYRYFIGNICLKYELAGLLKAAGRQLIRFVICSKPGLFPLNPLLALAWSAWCHELTGSSRLSSWSCHWTQPVPPTSTVWEGSEPAAFPSLSSPCLRVFLIVCGSPSLSLSLLYFEQLP